MRRCQILILSLCFILSGCSSCSRSAQKQMMRQHQSVSSPSAPEGRSAPLGPEQKPGKTIVKMTKVGGVYQVPVYIDDVKMFFIFDTGASTISISETEAIFLKKQGLLQPEDIKKGENFSDATGKISEGTVIVLKTVRIGDRTLENVEASVVHNMDAPLLFGQSAMEKFGKISIDNTNQEIVLE